MVEQGLTRTLPQGLRGTPKKNGWSPKKTGLNNMNFLERDRFKRGNMGVVPLEGHFPKGNGQKSYVCAGAYARGVR